MVDFNPLIAGKPNEANPLHKFFRQPKVYTTLPSKGLYYPAGALEMPETNELPVYAMTAKDELTMKTPDALLNGQATVDVIKSCVPCIKDPWSMPSVDLDAILIAIRIATYGEKLEITTKVPVTGEERSYQVDLRQLLSKLVSVEFAGSFEINNMLVKVRPLTYSEFTKSNLKTFEEQRVFALVNDDTIPDEEKLSRFNASFRKLTDLTVDMLGKSVYSITVDGTEVTNSEHIQEFLQNSDKNFFNTVMEFLEEEKKKFQIEPIKVSSTDEDIAAGAPATFNVPITFDQSNFFA
tara:strand:+ start:2519 stop:3400 length:882 start_codon:yes stop_codon:yes gene_type:complete